MWFYSKMLRKGQDDYNKYSEKKALRKRKFLNKTTIKDHIVRYLIGKKNLVSYKFEALVNKDKRDFQIKCEKEFKVYLDRYSPKKTDTFTIENLGDGQTVICLNDVNYPIIKLTTPATNLGEVVMLSPLQKELGLTDSDTTVEGYA